MRLHLRGRGVAVMAFARWLSRSNLLWKSSARPKCLKQLTQGAQSSNSPSVVGSRRNWLLLAGLGSCAIATWGLSRARRETRPRLFPTVQAGGKGEDGKGKEKAAEEKPKISARELRYKAFASYVYKGEPYMSARDFLESLIRDEPRCE